MSALDELREIDYWHARIRRRSHAEHDRVYSVLLYECLPLGDYTARLLSQAWEIDRNTVVRLGVREMWRERAAEIVAMRELERRVGSLAGIAGFYVDWPICEPYDPPDLLKLGRVEAWRLAVPAGAILSPVRDIDGHIYALLWRRRPGDEPRVVTSASRPGGVPAYRVPHLKGECHALASRLSH